MPATDADHLTSALTNLPFVLSSSPTARREDEVTHSMRDLAYFIGTFAVALLLGIGSAWYMIEYGSLLTTTKVGPWASWDSEGKPDALLPENTHNGVIVVAIRVAEDRQASADCPEGGH